MSLAAGGAAASSVLSAASSITGGIIGNKEAEAQAEFVDFAATQQSLEARRGAIVELERVNQIQARQFAAVGASGLATTASAIAPALKTGAQGKESFELAGLGGAISQGIGAAEAEALRNKGKLALLSGVLGAGQSGLSLSQVDFGKS